jgi:hypothetical protein
LGASVVVILDTYLEQRKEDNGMSTVHRHSLKKANQSQRKRASQPPTKKSKSPLQSSTQAAKRFWRRRWLWVSVIVVVVIVSIGLGSWYYDSGRASTSLTTSTHAQVVPTPLPTATPTWQTVHTLNGSSTGNATKKLQLFTVSSNWQITWQCQGVNGVDDWLYIAIYNANGSLYNAGAQVTCVAAKQVTGSVQEAKQGKFYLTVDANTSWTITIQDQKE